MSEPATLDLLVTSELPSNPELRKLIDRLLRSDSDLSAFCQDYFPDIELRFAANMERGVRISLLLREAAPEAVASALADRCEGDYAHAFLELLQQRQSKRPATNPYRGLEAFSEEDASLFFGREAAVDALYARLQSLHQQPDQRRLLTVLGPSGSGKSSLARAGLVARLRRESLPGLHPLRVATLRPGSRPLERLALAMLRARDPQSTEVSAAAVSTLTRELGQPDADGQFDRLRLEVAMWPDSEQSPLLLLVDQLEEIYTQCSDAAAREAFVSLLLHAAADRSRQVLVVLTLRSDFIGETMQHPQLNRAIGDSHELVTAMQPAELRRAIAEPARRVQRPLDAATVDLILKEALGSDGALPLLQFALHRIFEGVQNGRPAFTTLREIGGVGGALAQRAQEIADRLSSGQRATLRRALLGLIRLGDGARDTRRQAAVADLCGRGQREADVLSVLRHFADRDARLVTLSESAGRHTAEITHEALFEHWAALRGWIAESRDDRRFHERVAEAARLWSESGRPPGRLWRPPDLDLLREFESRCPEDLSPLQSEFMHASAEALDREQAERAEAERLRAAQYEEIRQQLLATYIERGWQELDRGNHPEAAMWLHRAQEGGSREAVIPTLLAEVMPSLDAQLALFTAPSGISDARFSPDGKTLFLLHRDGTLWLWDVATNQLRHSFPATDDEVATARFAPRGQKLLLSAISGTVSLLCLSELAQVRICHAQSLGWQPLLSPDGCTLYTCDLEDTFWAWDLKTGGPRFSLSARDGGPSSLELCPGGRYLVGMRSAAPRQPRIYDARSGAMVRDCQPLPEDAAPSALYGLPDGCRLIVVDKTHVGHLYSLATGRRITSLQGEAPYLHRWTVSPNGRELAVLDCHGSVNIHSAEDGVLRCRVGDAAWLLHSVVFAPHGASLALLGHDRHVRLIDTASQRVVACLSGQRGEVRFVRFSPDGRRLVLAGDDGIARMYWLPALVRDLSLEPPLSPFAAAVLMARTETLVGSTADSRIEERQVPDGRLHRTWEAPDSPIVAMHYDPQLQRLWLGCADGTLQLRQIPSGAIAATFPGLAPGLTSLRQSPDGRCIAVVVAQEGKDALALFSTDGSLLRRLPPQNGPIWRMQFSPDGKRLLLRGQSYLLDSLNTHGGESDTPSFAVKIGVLAAQYQGDDCLIACKTGSRTEVGWLYADQRICRLPMQPPGWGLSGCFSPDGRLLLLLGEDGMAQLWDVGSGRLTVELSARVGMVEDLLFTPDGSRVLVVCIGYVQIFDIQSGRQLCRRRIPSGRIKSAMLSEDGGRLLLLNQEGALCVLEMYPDQRPPAALASVLAERVRLRFEGRGLVRSNPDESVALGYAPPPLPLAFSERWQDYQLGLLAWQRDDAPAALRALDQAMLHLLPHGDQLGAAQAQFAQQVIALVGAPERQASAVSQAIARLASCCPTQDELVTQLVQWGSVAHDALFSPPATLLVLAELRRMLPDHIGMLGNHLEVLLTSGQPAQTLAQAHILEKTLDPSARPALLAMLCAAALELGERVRAESWLGQLRAQYDALADGQLTTWEFGGLQHALCTRQSGEQTSDAAASSMWIPDLVDLTYLLRLPKSATVAAQIEEVCASLLSAAAPETPIRAIE